MPRSKLTASELHAQCGELLSQPPFSEASTARVLHGALPSRQPPVEVSVGAVTIWWGKYKSAKGAETVPSAQDLEERYGDSIRHLGVKVAQALQCPAQKGASVVYN